MRLSKIAFTAVFLFASICQTEGFADEARPAKFSETVTKEGHRLELQGTGHKRFFFMRAFDAGFYAANGVTEDQLLSDVPKYLEVEYHLGIPAKSLSDFTVSYMKLNVTPDEFSELKSEVELMRKYFVDLRPNDRFSLTYLPQVGTQFSYNGELRGTIAGEKFGRALFSVWIGKRPFDPALRRNILGLEKAGSRT